MKLQVPINSEGDLFEYFLEENRVKVGRRHDNDIRIKERFVSAYHAELIKREDGQYLVRDCDSSNGTFLNGTRVSKVAPIADGDTIRFGKLKCLVSSEGSLKEDTAPLPDSSPEKLASEDSSFQPTPLISAMAASGAGGDGGKHMERLSAEVASLKRQLDMSEAELERSRTDLSTVSRHLAAEKQRTLQLEAEIKKHESNHNKMARQLRAEKVRGDDLEIEMDRRHKEMTARVAQVAGRLEAEEHENARLLGALEVLEAERNRHKEQSIEFAAKLRSAREGFSFMLDGSQQSEEARLGSEEEFDAAQSEVRALEAELEDIQKNYREMEMRYQDRIRLAEEARAEAAHSLVSVEADLEATRSDLHQQRSRARNGNGNDGGTTLEFDPVQRTGAPQPQPGDHSGVAAEDNFGKLRRLEMQTAELQKENKELIARNNELTHEVAQAGKPERGELAELQKNEAARQANARRLETILQKLNESERRVRDLKKLESDLERSIENIQKKALSRRGIYRDNGSVAAVMWPETEELICRELIERVELLDDMLRQYKGKWFFPKIAEQLNLLRDSFITMLKNHSVDQFDLAPGSELTVDARSRIHLITEEELSNSRRKRKFPAKVNGKRNTIVVETLRPGYVYRKGAEDVVIRKAEVVVR